MRLRVATLNVWALPFGMARHSAARMQAIGSALPGLDVDVVAFQEVWTEEARRSLVEAGARAGLTEHWSNRGELAGGGLLALPAGCALAALAERPGSEELRAYDALLRQLDQLAAPGGAPHSRASGVSGA